MRIINLLPIMATIFILGCSTISGVRKSLQDMPEADYSALQAQVFNLSVKGGKLLNKSLPKPANRKAVQDVIQFLIKSIDKNTISANDMLRVVLNRLQEEITNNNLKETLKDVINLIDVVVGQINIGIDGKFTEREKLLITTLLSGVYIGLE